MESLALWCPDSGLTLALGPRDTTVDTRRRQMASMPPEYDYIAREIVTK